MRIIRGKRTDPYFNLASEEYLLESASDDVFMLWQNAPAVIIGKNQNAYAEVNIPYAEEKGIAVVRRLTGGGAVFHDLGNVNYTFITKAPEEPKIDFAVFAQPMIDALASLGIAAELGGRNDILADGCKISGNAQCTYRRGDGTRMLLHHGTLLYDADMSALEGVLLVDPAKLRSKGIKSVRSRVGNLRQIGGLSMTVEQFEEYLLTYAKDQFGSAVTEFSDGEICAIENKTNGKYSLWEWNFGKSPEYGSTGRRRFPYGSVTADYTVDRGVIKDIKISGDFFGVEDTSVIEEALAGCRYETDAVEAVLRELPVSRIISGASAEDIADLLFGRNE